MGTFRESLQSRSDLIAPYVRNYMRLAALEPVDLAIELLSGSAQMQVDCLYHGGYAPPALAQARWDAQGNLEVFIEWRDGKSTTFTAVSSESL